jgi:hypothetical protein
VHRCLEFAAYFVVVRPRPDPLPRPLSLPADAIFRNIVREQLLRKLGAGQLSLTPPDRLQAGPASGARCLVCE